MIKMKKMLKKIVIFKVLIQHQCGYSGCVHGALMLGWGDYSLLM
ncbi:hypothetical protein yberc0001_38860 [Yersinia bercovieri ATCC 43970]|uniref:Uncharacterized protein n=1 Tax=Yersinia bercovieri ATCC 43970 TaxID=349968 RepID=A0ABM9XU17_YERBE|nr:hypothetical protein yberc0001_38860 [Yersinia bercovieri ATCC 43970]